MRAISLSINDVFQMFLSVVLCGGVVLSLVIPASAAKPNPGHDFTEVGGGAMQGDLVYGSAADVFSALAKNTSATRYLSNTGTDNNPAWAQVDLTNGVTGVLPAGNGGTGNGFFSVAGPASTTKIFTFPNVDATILTTDALVTILQGGFGDVPTVDDQLVIATSTTAGVWTSVPDCTATAMALIFPGGCHTIAGALLDSDYHTDVTTGTVARGDLITGQGANPTWASLAKGTADQRLSMDASATDVAWATKQSGYALRVQALATNPTERQTVYFGQLPKAPVTTANISKVYIPKSGTITRALIYTYSTGAGGNQNWSLYIRMNNTTDTLIETRGVSANERIFQNNALNIAVTAGEYFEIKGVQPCWGTVIPILNLCVGASPTGTTYAGYVWIE